MIVNIHLNEAENPMEYTTIEKVIKAEYRYNKATEAFLIYLETDSSFITIPVNAIESIEIKEN